MSTQNSASIRSRLDLFVGVLGVISLMTAVLVLRGQLQLSRTLAEDRTRNIAQVTESAISQFAGDTRQIIEGLAAQPGIRAMEVTVCQRLVTDGLAVLPQYTNFFVVSLDRQALCAARGVEPGERAPRATPAWWELASHPDSGFVVGPPIKGRLTGESVVVFSTPVVAESGERVGYVGASAPVDRFLEILQASDPPEGGVLTLARWDGTVIARSEDMEAWVGRRLPDRGIGETHASQGTGIEVTESADGVPTVFAFETSDVVPWTVYVGIPEATLRSTALEGLPPQFIGLAFLLLVPTLLALRLRHQIGSSVGLITGRLRSTAQDDPEIPASVPSEFRAIAQVFNETLEERNAALVDQRTARERLSSIIENAVFGIYVVDGAGRLVQANPALSEMLGYGDPAELLGQPSTVFHPKDGIREVLLDKAEAGGRTAELQFRRKDGTLLPVRISWSQLIRNEGGDWYEVMVEDLSDRRELETQIRESQKLEAVGRLAGGVAHDFNNRLTVISGQAELLLDELGDDPDHRETLESILYSASRSAELTAQLLAFSRRQVAQPRLLELRKLTLDMHGLLERLLGADAELEIEAGPEVWVRADPGQLEQIVMNLCTNARDALEGPGRITVAVDARTLDAETAAAILDAEAGRYSVLSVRDTGHGMDEPTRERIFEPFFTTKPQGKGTGLGLSTVYGIAVQSGGHIQVQSWPGRGTDVQIWLPSADPPPAAADESDAAPSGEKTEAELEGRGRVVLVAEDEDAVREVVVAILERAGFQVMAAEDGLHALALAAEAPGIDLLVTDVLMPGMEGTELADRLTASRPGLPVLFISGYTDEPPNLDADPGSVRSFLGKPFTQQDLRDRVLGLLRETSPPRSG